jgi:nucleoside-diphosphate-sugar epimerase
MKILVTGSEGNIGSKLVPYLRDEGHDIFRCDIKANADLNYAVININSPNDLAVAFKNFQPEVVYHLAAMVSRITCEHSPSLTIETNLSGLYNVIHLCREYKARLIYFSTSEVYGNISGMLSEHRKDLNPNNIYGLSKLMGERLVEYEVTKGLNALIVRPFMFYDEDETLGSNRSAMIRFAEMLVRGNKITIHKGSYRNWMHISDAVRVLTDILYINNFDIINIGSPEPPIETAELALMMCNYLHLNYDKYVIETTLPKRMTLIKLPDLTKQDMLTNIKNIVSLRDGIVRVIEKVKTRI